VVKIQNLEANQCLETKLSTVVEPPPPVDPQPMDLEDPEPPTEVQSVLVDPASSLPPPAEAPTFQPIATSCENLASQSSMAVAIPSAGPSTSYILNGVNSQPFKFLSQPFMNAMLPMPVTYQIQPQLQVSCAWSLPCEAVLLGQ